MPLTATIVLLFLLATIVALVAKRFRVPYTVALVLAGLAVGGMNVLAPPVLTKELLFAVFLPGLLFEAAFHLDAEEFWQNRAAIVSLALPGVLAATLLIAPALVGILGAIGGDQRLAWGPAFVFATLIAATDPIAVVAIVRTLGAPARLAVLIEGESLLNDGTAAVLFSLTVAYVLGVTSHAGALVWAFLYAIGVGALVGAAAGFLTARLLGWLDDPTLMITVTTIAAYGSFVAGEALGASGVIATVMAGLLSGRRTSLDAIHPDSRAIVRAFWDYVAFALNSLIFLLIGLQARAPALVAAWKLVLVAYVVVTMARATVTFGLNAVHPRRWRMSGGWTAVLTWSGLRGALALVLALGLPPSAPQRDLVVTITMGVVVLSIVIQGLTVGPLLRRLGIASDDDVSAPPPPSYAPRRGTPRQTQAVPRRTSDP